MFPFQDPGFHLDQYHQRAAELHRTATESRIAREASAGRHRQGWWGRPAHRPRPVRAPAAS
ncbi:hypothetical protein ACPCHT_39230 [Nucisporomicrobium flavum]|uniref:hypothetical protein n=1 Tax=Nucisporomicrobium flavum TaxID=2785915 RepID=UPI0018F47F65|nr:hypothetical protein [Nucisporomicrobium flavum]